ncbi:protein MICROTUBULE BINDING PROTEIN 2C [Apium graveolens]|uniref:protein MICROTUBULE BINDING PROTEIN 2C n=1 Tax=Apium graveolens TaxID=4045 RepID=UPI003D78EBEE
MYESQQHFVDLDDSAAANSWLAAGQDRSVDSPLLRRTHDSFSSAPASNLDRNLFNDLVEIVPLVQSLIDRKAKTSFTRRASVIYTKTPKASELKGKNAAQSIPAKKRRDLGDKDQNKQAGDNKDGCANDFSFLPISTTVSENSEELLELRDQVVDLQRKLSEKDELLKSAEIMKGQMTSEIAKLDELKQLVSEKDSVAKHTQQQLSDAKIMLADKQAALEKLRWEAMTSNTLAQKLQEDVNTMQEEMSSIMILCEGLRKNSDDVSTEDYDIPLNNVDHIPEDVDSSNELEMQRMEDAQEAYIAAVAAANEIQDEYSIAAARSARLHLLSLVIKN